METRKTKKVKIGDTVFSLWWSVAAFLNQLNRVRESPDTDLMNNFHYFFELAQSGAKIDGVEFILTFEKFLELIDPEEDAIEKINRALTEMFGKGERKNVESP